MRLIKKRLILSSTLFGPLLLSGCGTIHFVQGDQSDITEPVKDLHHTALMEVIEISPPAATNVHCAPHHNATVPNSAGSKIDKEWRKISIEKTFLNSLLPFPPFINLYGAWTVSTYCAKPTSLKTPS